MSDESFRVLINTYRTQHAIVKRLESSIPTEADR